MNRDQNDRFENGDPKKVAASPRHTMHARLRLEEMEAGTRPRREALEQISKELDNRFPVSYYGAPDSYLSDDDIAPLEDLLLKAPLENGLLLLLSSPGGSGLAAERLINVCRVYSDDNFRVLVPKQAKSAATMVCLGADAIYMSPTSELGPIDPQVPIADGGWTRYVPADLVIKAYEGLLADARACVDGRIEPYLQQLQLFDIRLIEVLKRELDLGDDIAIKALKKGMMAGTSKSRIRQKIRPFVEANLTSSHGRPILAEQARQCGLNILDIDVKSTLWSAVMEYNIRVERLLLASALKVIETPEDFFYIPRG